MNFFSFEFFSHRTCTLHKTFLSLITKQETLLSTFLILFGVYHLPIHTSKQTFLPLNWHTAFSNHTDFLKGMVLRKGQLFSVLCLFKEQIILVML